MARALSLDPALGALARPRALGAGDAPGALEVIALLLAGAAGSALAGLLKLRLGVPGHHVALALLPIALGVSCVPRRGAGTLAGIGSFVTLLAFDVTGTAGFGPGALTSTAMAGPMLDLAVRFARRGDAPLGGLRLYAAFACAGLAANLIAFGVRFAFRLGEAKPMGPWLAKALWSYPTIGLAAGLASGALWFRLRPRSEGPAS